MLQPIPEPTTKEEKIYRWLARDDSIARCPESGAKLCKSRRQYTLVIPESYTTRHWSRRKVASDQEAIERANKSLEKILKERG